ncbi:MAG: hypothetical protein HQL20_02515 [Candidatus Omnitrophica bacterium]|nr:hypothetical protein [Candidatus Omnitrophota bacterium]
MDSNKESKKQESLEKRRLRVKPALLLLESILAQASALRFTNKILKLRGLLVSGKSGD